ncbi:MAG: DMT family transporter [Actinomycetota bacterium]
MTSQAAGRALVLGAAVLWGTTGTAQALAPGAASPPAVGAIRLIVGGVALMALASRRGPIWPRGVARAPAAGSAAAMAAYQLFFFAAVAATGVAVGTAVAIGSAPVLAGLLAALVRGERLTRRWAVATSLAMAGCVLLVGGGRAIEVDPGGVLLALGAGASYATYAVASKQLLERAAPLQAAAITFAGAALLLSPLLIFVGLSWLASARGVAVALHLGLIATAVAYLLFGRGLRVIPVTTAATLSLAEPVTAALLGIALLDERPAPVALLGIAFILAGLVIVTLRSGSLASRS